VSQSNNLAVDTVFLIHKFKSYEGHHGDIQPFIWNTNHLTFHLQHHMLLLYLMVAGAAYLFQMRVRVYFDSSEPFLTTPDRSCDTLYKLLGQLFDLVLTGGASLFTKAVQFIYRWKYVVC